MLHKLGACANVTAAGLDSQSLAAPALLCCGAAAGLAYGVRGRSAQLFGPSSFRGAGQRRSVALTFDDGPSEGTLRLLEYLARENVPATFFLCGANVARLGRVARQVAEAGHEIGNHTYTHRRLCPRLSRSPNLLGAAEVLHEFASAQELITSGNRRRARIPTRTLRNALVWPGGCATQA